MDAQLETQPGSIAKLSVTLSPSETTRYFEQAARQLSASINVPGFRRGKAPRSVVAKRVGAEYLAQQALEVALTGSYYEAVKRHSLRPIGRPTTEISSDGHHLERDGLSYTATVPVMPEVTLGNYQKVKVKRVASEFAEKQVEETLAQLVKSRATSTEVDRPAASGDRVEIDFVGTHKGKEVPGAKSENHPMVLGDDNFVPGFADQVVGMQTGQVKKFKVTFPKDYHEKSLAKAKVEFTVTMRKVEEVVPPELNDELASQFGAKDLADLKRRLGQNLRAEKDAEAQSATEMAVLDKVMAGASVEIPELLVEEELNKMLAEFRQGIERQGMPYDKYLENLGKTEDDLRTEQRDEAGKRAKMSLVLNAIQEAEKVEPSAKQIEAELANQLAQAPDAETTERIKSDEFRSYVKRVLGNRLVVAKLVERSTA